MHLKDYSNCVSALSMHSGSLAAIIRSIKMRCNEEIETARVCLNDNLFHLEISPKFWEEIEHKDRVFLLAHEAMHIAMGHLIRGKNLPQQVMNVAADSVVNDHLLEVFNMPVSDRMAEQVITTEKLNVFSASSMETIAAKLNYNQCNRIILCRAWPREHQSAEEVDVDQALEDLARRMVPGSLSEIGWTTLGSKAQHMEKKAIQVRAADTIIRYLRRGRRGRQEDQVETWSKEHRRATGELIIPGSVDDISKIGCKINLYMDSSGSMAELAEMVTGCAEELSRRGVAVERFCFDIDVYAVQKRRWAGGGGTDFRCVIKHAECKNNSDLNLVITDGFANPVRAKEPSKWMWLITDGGTSKCVGSMPHKPVTWAFPKR
jgi:predicted metal-dependent peptidase